MLRPPPRETKLLISVWHRFPLWCFPVWLTDAIRQRYPEMVVVHLPDYAGLDEELADVDILVGFSVKPEQFARVKKLKWIHSTAAAVHQLMFPELVASPVIVTNARTVHAVCMAEHTMSLLLALARRLPAAVRHQLESRWAQQPIWEESSPIEINGRVLGLVGLGAIGSEVARRARVFGMRIVAIKRHPQRNAEAADEVYPPEELNRLLEKADFVVLCAPATAETRGMISYPQLDAMKKNAYLINVSRGTLVDEQALVGALETGQIAGAALDVTAEEPLPSESPLWRAPHLLITPHMAAVSERLWHRHAALLLSNLERWFAGQELENIVDKTLGY